VLGDAKTLQESGVRPGAVLHLRLPVKGGLSTPPFKFADVTNGQAVERIFFMIRHRGNSSSTSRSTLPLIKTACTACYSSRKSRSGYERQLQLFLLPPPYAGNLTTGCQPGLSFGWSRYLTLQTDFEGPGVHYLHQCQGTASFLAKHWEAAKRQCVQLFSITKWLVH